MAWNRGAVPLHIPLEEGNCTFFDIFFAQTLANSKIMRTFATQTTKRGAWRGKAGLCKRKNLRK